MRHFRLKLGFLFFLTCLLSAELFAQGTQYVSTRPVITGESPNLSARRDLSDRNLSLGAPRFVEPGLYNAFDHNGSALGLLERESGGLNLGLRFLSSSQENEAGDVDLSSKNFILPYLGFTIEDILSSRMYYRKIADHTGGANKTDLSLHMGGMDLGFGAKSGIFQMGISMHGSMGESKDSEGNQKVLFGIHKLDASMGTQVHPTVRLGGHFGVGASFDSLRSVSDPSNGINSNTVTWERIFDLELPNFGFHFDIGDTSVLPLLSNVSLNFYTLRQIGTWKQNVNNINGREFQYNPLWHSGHTFKMKTTYNIKNGGLSYWPSVMLEKWGRKSQRYHFYPDNKSDPFKENGVCANGAICTDADSTVWFNSEGTNHKWLYSGINFGLGGFIEIFNYASVFAEWELHSLVFEVAGDGDLNAENLFNRILIGTEGKLHNIPQWKIPEGFEFLVRASFSTGKDNGTIENYRPYQFQLYDRYTNRANGRDYDNPSYYTPVYGDMVDWFNFNFGLGAVFYEKISADIYTSLYSIEELDDVFSGFEFGTTLQIHL